jgi:hypothetical protein
MTDFGTRVAILALAGFSPFADAVRAADWICPEDYRINASFAAPAAPVEDLFANPPAAVKPDLDRLVISTSAS